MRDNRVFKLNSSWQIIGKDSIRKAIKKVYKGRALFMLNETGETFTFDKWLRLDPTDSFVTVWPYGRIRKPKHIICSYYSGMGMSARLDTPRISRWNRFVRDEGRCCFCNEKLSWSKGGFTLDHLHPQSKGGGDDWMNIVIACHACNNKKANKDLKDSGMKLIRLPHVPTAKELRDKSIKLRNEIWLNDDNNDEIGD